jgi:hypothetical protein
MNVWEFRGGSLNDIIVCENKIIKSYKGNIDRGFEKLRKENDWLNKIGHILLDKFPCSLPQVIDFVDNEEKGITELHLERLPRQSFTKLILLENDLDIGTFEKKLDITLTFLIENLYPIKKENMPPYDIYKTYHANRLALARRYFRTIPYISPILDASSLNINNISCPSVNEFLAWLDAKAKDIFTTSNLYTYHGNFHLDNVLISKTPIFDTDAITFIDPRGDMLGPAHYDYSKILISLEGYYDEIHYEKFNLDFSKKGKIFSMNIEIDDEKKDYYIRGLSVLLKYLDKFAELESVDRKKFIIATYTSACIHILSFIFYHAYRETTPPNRIRAFFCLYALFAKKLIDMYNSDISIEIPDKRLKITE